MRQFPIQVDGQVLHFDTDGRALDAAANIVGQWSTADNKLQFRPAGGGAASAVEVGWAFNDSNQLTISQNGVELFAIRETADEMPRYRLVKNELVVDPDGDGDFEFHLGCQFGLNADGNLVLSIGGQESVLDGYIEDSKSRFRFQFFDKPNGLFPSSLVLAGQWERKLAGGDQDIRLHFRLDDPALEIAAQPLDLPAAVKVDPTRNHLALVYQSKNNGERRLQFLGSFELKPGFTLVFRIDDVKDGGVRKSRIEVETNFEFDVAKGALSLFVGREKGPNSQVIEVGGTLQAKLKNGALDWTFAYRKSTAGGQSVTTIATALQFVFDQNRISIAYQQDGKARKLDVTGKIVKENFTLSGGVSIARDPQGRSLRAFVGVSF